MHKIIDIEERIPSLRERRKKRKNVRFLLLLVILAFALCTLLYFQLPISHIKNIEVVGQKIETKNFYIKHSGISEGDSLWGFEKKSVVDALTKEAVVKKVDVERYWPNKVVIHVTENKKVAILKSDKGYEYVLENGKLFRSKSANREFELPILINVLKEEERKEIVAQLMNLNKDISQLISQIELASTTSNPQLVHLYMNDGFEVRANVPNLASRLQYYPSIISQLSKEKKGVINLEIGGYYNEYKKAYK